MLQQAPSVEFHEALVKQFEPDLGLAATNSNDLREFIYEWFTHFEHVAKADFFLSHLDDQNVSVTFPGRVPLTSHSQFASWYENFMAQTLWNFHDVSSIDVERTATNEFMVSFIVNWYGEVSSASDQADEWKSRSDSLLYHHKVRQTWTVIVRDRLVIQTLVVTDGDTPSPVRS